MRLYLEFDRIVRDLKAAKIRFAVAGGIAVGLYGFVRATKDIDLLVMPGALERIRTMMRRAGYSESREEFRFRRSGLGMRRFYRREPKEEDLLVVDVLLAESKQMQGVLRRAKRVKYADTTVPVVALDDLTKMKRLRGSKQDEADIEQLRQRRHENT